MTKQEKRQQQIGHFRLYLNGILFPLNAIMSVDRIITMRLELEQAAIRLHEELMKNETGEETDV